MKKIFFIIIAVTCSILSLLSVGCEQEDKENIDTREHVTLLVYDNANSSVYYCELTETEQDQTIEIPYRPNGYDFYVATRIRGNVTTLCDDVGRSFGKYVSPTGEETFNWSYVWHKGTYTYIFGISERGYFHINVC